MTHICVSKLTIIGSDNGLSPSRRQAIIWTNAGILLIRPLGTNFNEILIDILPLWFMKMCLKVSSAKLRPFCLGLNVLTSLHCFRTLSANMMDSCENGSRHPEHMHPRQGWTDRYLLTTSVFSTIQWYIEWVQRAWQILRQQLFY